MKLTTTTVEQLLIDDLMQSHRLDPVRVIMERTGEYSGHLTVICYGRSWTTYFSNMGEPMCEFIKSASAGYLADRLVRSCEHTSEKKNQLDECYLLKIIDAIKAALRQEGGAA